MKKLIIALFLICTSTFAESDQFISDTIRAEWKRFRALVEEIQPDGQIGGYMDYKEYGETTLLWRISNDPNENEVIRFFMDRPGPLNFAVTYHKGTQFIPGKMALRRFIGTEPTGWINHTIEFDSGLYLGRQGSFPYTLRQVELDMMEQFEITAIK